MTEHGKVTGQGAFSRGSLELIVGLRRWYVGRADVDRRGNVCVVMPGLCQARFGQASDEIGARQTSKMKQVEGIVGDGVCDEMGDRRRMFARSIDRLAGTRCENLAWIDREQVRSIDWQLAVEDGGDALRFGCD